MPIVAPSMIFAPLSLFLSRSLLPPPHQEELREALSEAELASRAATRAEADYQAAVAHEVLI